jgi:hypothetical protein
MRIPGSPIVRRLRRGVNHQRNLLPQAAEHAIDCALVAYVEVKMKIPRSQFALEPLLVPFGGGFVAKKLAAHIVIDTDDIQPKTSKEIRGF